MLEMRSEVKVNLTVTQKWYLIFHHSKMHPHTKFGISTSNNMGHDCALVMVFLEKRSEVKVNVTVAQKC